MSWDPFEEVETFRARLGHQKRSERSTGSSRGRLPDHIRARASGRHVRPAPARSQRVAVKPSFVSLSGASREKARAHLNYLLRDGAGAEGKAAELFTRPGEEACKEEFLDRSDDDPRQFRLIVSPEFGERLDLQKFTQDYMEKVERDLGRDLDWVAVVHENTEHPHAHIALRGRDRDGEELFLTRDYLLNGLRRRAQELATFELGPRTDQDRDYALSREVSAERFTSLDRELLQYSVPGPSSDAREFAVNDASAHLQSKQATLGRLSKLSQLGLARDVSRSSEPQRTRWEISTALEQTLRERQRDRDIQRRMAAAKKAEGPNWIRGYTVDEPLLLRIRDRGLDNEVDGSTYVVADGSDGRTYHLTERQLGSASTARIDQIIFAKPSKTDVAHLDVTIEPDARVDYEGPHWLDRELVAPRVEPSQTGFGAKLRDLKARRIEHLKQMSLVGEGAKPPRDLLVRTRSRERERFTKQEATARGCTARRFEQVGEEFRGRVEKEVTLQGGTYSVVANTDEILVLPTDRYLQKHRNKPVQVRLEVGTDGRLRPHVRALPTRARPSKTSDPQER